jgi:hypothetical protein
MTPQLLIDEQYNDKTAMPHCSMMSSIIIRRHPAALLNVIEQYNLKTASCRTAQ